MSRTDQRPGMAADREEWLAHCEGYRVDSPEGRIGIVEDVRFSIRPYRAEALVVRLGLFARRRVVVPVDEVDEIDPLKERILLSTTDALASGDLAYELRTRLPRRRERAMAGERR